MSVQDRDDAGGWKPRPAPPPEPALDPTTWAEGREAIADLRQRVTALEGEVAALRAEVLDLRGQRPG